MKKELSKTAEFEVANKEVEYWLNKMDKEIEEEEKIKERIRRKKRLRKELRSG